MPGHTRLLGLLASLAWVAFLSSCQGRPSTLPLPAPMAFAPQTKSFNDTDFEMKSCEITAERTAVCRLLVTNRYRDKRIEIDRRITIQDDSGTDHPVTAGGFGQSPERPQWNQVAVADSSYHLTVIATNLSTRATSIRAVIFSRLLVRSMQGQALGYRDRVIFSRPDMVSSAPRPAVTPPEPPTPPTAEPEAEGGGSVAAPADAQAFPNDRWQVVGYWNYDAADGQHLAAQGLVLRPVAGAGLGQQWSAHLELENHASLPPRKRSLWPVKIHAGQRKVCADYPGYPSYAAFIDMPGESADGVYLVARCTGEE